MSEKTSDQQPDEESQATTDQKQTDQKQAAQTTADAEHKTDENTSTEPLPESEEGAASQTGEQSEEDDSSEEDVSMAAFKVVIEQENAEDPDGGQEEDPLLETDEQRILVPGGYPVLSLKHVDYTRKVQGRPEQILDDVDLEFQRRRIYSVETTTPSGRAALMALMTGLRAPTQGSVLFRGTDLRQLLASDYRGHQIGAIFGTDALRRDLTAVQNLVYTMEASGRTFLGPKDNLARQLLDEVGFPERLQDKLTADLGHLDFRLASVARALCCECDVLIADEPTEGLEPSDWDTLLATLKRVSRRHDCAVIILTSGGSDTVDEGTYDDRFIVD
ncbi:MULTISPECIES: ATP-binding cassette domain-containing protein [Bifidobacterium]|uniref:ATP-binding cassette domain-containing protein n=1 Tax=Bifidobacterium apousia TaxID=2750996 RepID=A0A556R392_9BIFI|nr:MULTISPECIES: ATP-binding cassette domain-containing protein [Bifidobacterium]MBI0072116.1 ATP-binding cassette domain-containing protein [Bifidobacterium sp. W8112]MBI0124677.1 ATP-binding cassette domain-containing protein [Bifidobacterium apousia]MBI0136787.1 ATP-binding cassette domain-containing protein [Bifidobacterium sp. W8120]TSJ83353.1 ATP-binding cassette domain-containing protein [Bifidobacterium apousia]